MTRREKNILIATGVVAVLGLGSLFVGGKPAIGPGVSAPAPNPQAAKIVENALTLAKRATPGVVERAVLAAIETPWRTKVFYDKPLATGPTTAKPAAMPRFTGYVELGSGRLAVIDGYEYQAGDTMEGGGYKVITVTADKVLLESLANGQKLELPYEGQESQSR